MNRANFNVPNNTVFQQAGQFPSIDPTAGLISATTTSSRQIQFALKLIF